MLDIFSPIFLLCLSLLYLSQKTGFVFTVPQSLTIIAFSAALAFYLIGNFSFTRRGEKRIVPTAYKEKRLKIAYFFIALTVALLISAHFLKEKEHFYKARTASAPYEGPGKGSAPPTYEKPGKSKPGLDIPRDEYITVVGKLTSFPEIGREYSVIYLETGILEYGGERKSLSLNIRVKVKGDLRFLHTGDCIDISVKFYRDTLNRNFFPNPFEDYFFLKRIHFSGYCKSKHMVTVQKKTGWAWRFIGRWRNKIRAAIEKKYRGPEGEIDPKGVFLEAILIGARGRVDNNLKNELLDAGVYHLLAISGAHIGIIAVFLLFLFKILRIPRELRYILTGAFLILFLILSGFRISAQRAVLMALLIFTARVLYLDINAFNIISFCGLLLLFKNPAAFLDPGFILTFTLTAAIVCGRRIFLPLLQGYRFKKIPATVKELLCANLSASLLSLPLALFFFKRYSFAGFPAGLLLLPLTAVITAAGILLVPLAPLFPAAAAVLLHISDFPLALFFKISGFFSEQVNLTIFRASPSLLPVVLILTAFFLVPAVKNRDFKKKNGRRTQPMRDLGEVLTKKALLTIIVIVFILTNLFITVNLFYYKPGHLEVFFLDVGQGDSQVVIFPGGEALLIDGGGAYYSDYETGTQVVLPFLLQQRIRIKWAAVSHFHPDHVGGITEILHIIKPEELWISAAARQDFFYKKFIKAARKQGVKIKKLAASFTKTIDGCRAACLYPEKFIESDSAHNNHSQVLKISDRWNSFLFTGDIGSEVEEFLIEKGSAQPGKHLHADVLKVPHHGSRTSSTLAFLECVSPRLAIFSYARGNRFNFPHPRVTKNYKKTGIITLSTADRGGIKITSLPGKIKIETSR
ncbi:MAG: DNA internalization-related competence protein ComEC/Rec2 [Candidatus Aminicenantes bacterium]|nr:DNA internalization-related competence protein ComEC/Rec2 [Candidatus Aminicenantes bacterium]